MEIESGAIKLVLKSVDEVRKFVETIPETDREHVSPNWLNAVLDATVADPWWHGFHVVRLSDNEPVGHCGFKGPPVDGCVEIAYMTEEAFRGHGFATESAITLANHALSQNTVTKVRAHTLPDHSASIRVLEKAGFIELGEVVDPEDGKVLRFEKTRLSKKNSRPQ